MRLRLPRLTFLWRFALVTFAVSLISALILVAALQRGYRQGVEDDAVATTLGRLSSQLTAPLDSLAANGRLTPATLADLERAATDAEFFPDVAAIRIYTPDGRAVYPTNAQSARGSVHGALAGDSILRTEDGNVLTAYSPIYALDEHVYVVAVDFLKDAIKASDTRGRTLILVAVAITSTITFFSLVVLAAGASREIERRRREAESTFVQTLSIIADVIDLRDPYTAGHSKRVAVYSRKLAAAINLPPRQLDIIESGALLHDIGKISIPDAVLFKPARLNLDERRIISTHPVVGARLLNGITAMEDVTPCVLHHHEKIDGTGYPDHLAGDAIPLGARIIAVADTFDAMTTDRPYRRALSVETAIAELVRVAGTQLEERLVVAFAELVVRGEIVPPPSLADIERAHAAEAAAQVAPQITARGAMAAT
jgi:putative nucleotidyltransferase with HDIG domain